MQRTFSDCGQGQGGRDVVGEMGYVRTGPMLLSWQRKRKVAKNTGGPKELERLPQPTTKQGPRPSIHKETNSDNLNEFGSEFFPESSKRSMALLML